MEGSSMSDDTPGEVVRLVPLTDDERRHEALRRLGEEWWEPPAELIDTLPKGGVDLRYLSHIWVRKAFQDADPDWWWEPMGYDDRGQPVIVTDSQGQPVGLWIWLHLLGTKMPGYGSVEPGKRDAIKELIGDALRNAGMRLVGGSLWVKQSKKPQKRSKAPLPSAIGKTPDPVEKARQAAEKAGEDAPQHESTFGKDFYDRMVDEHGDEVVNGAMATFKVAKFSELTPERCKVIEASLLSRARIERENAERQAQLEKEKGGTGGAK
jgi:hypothetical protein